MPQVTELLTIDRGGVHTLLARSPVTCTAFKEFLRATGQKLPPMLAASGSAAAPVTRVSRHDTLAYCQWAGSREGHTYRLPSMAELEELYGEDESDGVSMEIWAHTPGHTPEMRGGLREVFLCEWTSEIEEVPQPNAKPPRVLGSIFYPPWLRHGANASHAQAYLSATEGYSFVTFRLACDQP